jgi:hypothetical protein
MLLFYILYVTDTAETLACTFALCMNFYTIQSPYKSLDAFVYTMRGLTKKYVYICMYTLGSVPTVNTFIQFAGSLKGNRFVKL